jgi:DNA replication protein DnaC
MTQTISKVPVYMSVDGDWNISRLHSFLAWREYFNGNLDSVLIPKSSDGMCDYCNDTGMTKLNELVVRCICSIKEEEAKLRSKLNPFRSRHRKTSLSDLSIWGKEFSDENKPSVRVQEDSLAKAINLFERWSEYPDNKWITVYGNVGCGKTHMLSALAHSFGSWALYITAADFEQHVFNALDDNSLSDMLAVIKHAPILLLDDLGADYGSKFPKSNLRNVIDFRYNLPIEYPTVVATNLNKYYTMQYDARLGDRIFDQDNTHILHIMTPSWRTVHDTTDNHIG